MVMPMAGRVVAAVIGGLLVLTSMSSVIGTLIVPRPVSSRLTRWVDQAVDWAYQLVVPRAHVYWVRDRMLATQAATLLLAQLAMWLIVAYVGFALLLWPFASWASKSVAAWVASIRSRTQYTWARGTTS